MTESADNPKSKIPEHKPRPLIDLLVSIVAPSVILMKFSGEQHLGPVGGLITALVFPVSWGLFELIRYRKYNFIAILGLISVLLTGGIGLLKLDNEWLAIKEAAVPGVIGIAVLISTYTPYPLIKTLLFNPNVMDIENIKQRLEERGKSTEFEKRLLRATYYLSGTFFFSSFMNYVLAKWIVTSPAGSVAFNEQLGELTIYSYLMIALPSMVMMMIIMYYLWRAIHDLTGLTLEDVFIDPKAKQQE